MLKAQRLARHRWWITRIAILPVHLIFFTVVTFFMIRAIPGDPVLAAADADITPEQYAQVEESLGLDGPLILQLLNLLGRVATLDFGESIVSGRPVLEEFAIRMPATLELVGLALIAVISFSVLFSALVTFRPRNPVSRLISAYARTAGAVPEFVWGVAGIFLFYATLHWAPAPLGRVDAFMSLPERVTGFPMLDAVLAGQFDVLLSMLRHLALPVLVLAVTHSALLTKILISNLHEAIAAAPTRFRIASGAPRRVVVLSMYRRAGPVGVAVLGQMTGNLVGGAVILESLFGLGGMGQYAVDAINANDIVAIQGFLIVVSALALLVFLIVDIVNMLLDIRRRPGAAGVVA